MLRLCRALHTVPRLALHDTFAKLGVDGLYLAQGYAGAWLEYQKYLTTQLSLCTTGTRFDNRTPLQVLLLAAKDTTQQHTFHYALQAYNNHFFFEQLAPRAQAQATRPSRFILELAGLTLDDIRKEAVRLADTPGQGWVFLVERGDKKIELMRCRNDGTPFYYGKNQSFDFNTSADEAGFDEMAQRTDVDLTLPLLAIPFWDVAYYADYGLGGRAEFVGKVFDCINWDVVNRRKFQV